MHSNPAGSSKKRMRCDRIFSFKSFCEPGYPLHFRGGPFQDNMRALVELGQRETDSRGGGMNCWSFRLELHRNPVTHVSLFVVEETVERSRYRHCHHCRSIGWGHHMICKKRFHFVLPSKRSPPPTRASELISSCDAAADGKGGGAAAAATMESKLLMNLQGQVMHGVVHSNGFGHLLCVNGIEGGSEIVPGRQILDFWDRMCTGLGVRMVSLTDTAKMGTMNLRLVHGVAYGEPWFGRWGYRFGRGSYGVTAEMYQRSVDALRNLPLCLLVPHYGGGGARHELPAIVARYQAAAGHPLLTLGHLLHFMLGLRGRLPPDRAFSAAAAADYRGITAEPACRWSTRRVEMAAQVIVDALRRAESRWVPRQDVRDAARAYVGDTGLLDFVLKSLGNHIVGNYVVRRMVNPVTKILEYRLEDVSFSSAAASTTTGGGGSMALNDPLKIRMRLQTTRVQLVKDLHYLYKYVLKEQNPALNTGIFSVLPIAVRIILDSKQLVKDYQREMPWKVEGGDHHTTTTATNNNNNNIKLFCTACLRSIEGGREVVVGPHELVTLPAQATLGDLKSEVERCFRDIYLGLKDFAAESVVGIHAEDSDMIVGLVEPGSAVVVAGRDVGDGKAVREEEVYEGGADDDGTVDCLCGAKEDDGERMVCCDMCGVRQHTRCAGIPSGGDVPHVFLCGGCERDIAALPALLS